LQKRIHVESLSASALGLVSLLSLGGCSAMKVKMGWRVDLAETQVATIEASLPKGPAIAPGGKPPLVVKVTLSDGTILLTEGPGGGKVQWKDLAVTANVVVAHNKGVLSLPKDPRKSDAKMGRVAVTVPEPSWRAYRTGRSISIRH